MQHIAQYVSGERDYTKLDGSTGPLVYPAAHVYIYRGLYYLTNDGKDIFLAQQLFAILYIATLALVMACYWEAKVGCRRSQLPCAANRGFLRTKVPPYVFPLLILSKRLHSIFVLRCFNDCFAAFFLWLSIFLFQRRQWALGALVYSWGLGVKMSLLLALPAVGIILFLGRGFSGALRLASLMAQVQVAIGIPFLAHKPWAYLSRAFELSRQFMFKWTVNWRFVGEDTFLSRPFAVSLLVLHVAALTVFITTRWLKPARKSLAELAVPMLSFSSPFGEQEERIISLAVTPGYVLTTILSANVIGMLFARSLHYQFYAYLAWSTPFLLWKAGLHPVLQYGLWALQEWAWNVYPSTPVSSQVVVLSLAATASLTWYGARAEYEPHRSTVKDEAAKR